ncbi:MAG: PEP-CTERM sorting domain-containing protein [Betaproteobacteria bacterium]
MNKPLLCGALAFAAALAAPAHASTVALAADGQWNEFDVDSFAAPSFGTGWIDNTDGSALSFTFTIAAGHTGTLTVVDAGFAGDTFTVTNFGSALGATAGVAPGSIATDPVFDFSAAYANPSFSNGVFTLGAGSYAISGSLLQSVFDDAGFPLDATIGAVRLSVVPEASSAALLLAGLGALGLFARRRQGRAAA